MCGIIGYIGKKKALPILLDGLRRMEYRGYDSAGIAVLESNSVFLEKEVGHIADLQKKLRDACLFLTSPATLSRCGAFLLSKHCSRSAQE